MSYEKFYPGGWQSGESGGTPITPEALNHIENGIKQTYSDFAPAGYGLGDVAPTLWSGSVTDITKSGWYWYQDSTASGGPYHEGVILASIGPYHSRLDFFALHGNEYNGCHAVRVKNWNGWQEWEWVNPPMIPGVEYRTTERWNGKVVYTKLIYFGAMPNNGNKVVGHDIHDLEYPISCSAVAISSDWTFTLPSDYDVEAQIYFSPDGVVIRTSSDRNKFHAYVTVKYTKR